MKSRLSLEEQILCEVVKIVDNNLALTQVKPLLEKYYQERLKNEDFYKVVEFPEIQDYQELEWFDVEAILINSDEGLVQFGSSAYLIPVNRLKLK